ncbi:MAG: hypothetical protein G01um101418_258 [Parcubacteria group bacterium Gr01-1014_18]|nr:MAG: hypothetical protein Greene041636_225 [Parcubacteria group bacterium Greene0416_36]TSC81276.1 MAG: hypothetical protein G01um101418_258 [Parcubacteria group bacterium Gr01-1014_18]TSC99298.1 MAG: hypothetical protein Greene101420_226 [Parcubacteria group bacterium Greene1014_20]TSD06865.1 MAG: hypothetical protein Greene07142_599 [Parcubacteria group bacterium Greene0714_2]
MKKRQIPIMNPGKIVVYGDLNFLYKSQIEKSKKNRINGFFKLHRG